MEKNLVIVGASSSGKLSFASYYGDHMVLQKAPKRSLVWGYGSQEHIDKEVELTLLSNDGQHTSNYRTTVQYSKSTITANRYLANFISYKNDDCTVIGRMTV